VAEGESSGPTRIPKNQISLFGFYFVQYLIINCPIFPEYGRRLAIILCCGKTKCSKAFSNSPARRNSSLPIGMTTNTKIKPTVDDEKV
jgi:hypothetical protein